MFAGHNGIRERAMTTPHIDTHTHFNPPIGNLRAIARSLVDF